MPEEIQNAQIAEGIQPQDLQPENKLGGLPEDASERTKEQFEKLTKHNKELAEKVRLYEASQVTQPSDLLIPPEVKSEIDNIENLTPVQVDSIIEKMVDGEGNVDVTLLTKTLQEADRRAKDAEEKAKKAETTALETRKIVEADKTKIIVDSVHAQFPELNVYDDNYDPKFANLVKNIMLGQMVNGKQQDYLGAANEALEFYKPATRQTESPESIAAKAEINAGITSQKTATDRDDLIKRSRSGDISAIYQRIKDSGN